MSAAGNLSTECKEHLEQALETADPSEKDFHIRHVLQLCGSDGCGDPTE